jgi:hypothetical protein
LEHNVVKEVSMLSNSPISKPRTNPLLPTSGSY